MQPNQQFCNQQPVKQEFGEQPTRFTFTSNQSLTLPLVPSYAPPQPCATKTEVFEPTKMVPMDPAAAQESEPATRKQRDVAFETQVLHERRKLAMEQQALENRLIDLRRAKKSIMMKRKQMFKSIHNIYV